jgi:urea carboxylase
LRDEFPRGRHRLEIEPTTFRYADYETFLEAHADEIESFRTTQRQAFAEERQRWEDAGLHLDVPAEAEATEEATINLPKGAITLDSPVTVWKIEVLTGAILAAGAPGIVLEAMKMEIPVEADEDLEIIEILVAEGAPVRAGQPLLIAKPI